MLATRYALRTELPSLLVLPRARLARGASRSTVCAWGVARATEGSPLSHSLHCHPYCFVFLGILNMRYY